MNRCAIMTKKAHEIAKLPQTVAHVHFVTAASLHFDPLRILKDVDTVIKVEQDIELHYTSIR